MNSMDRFMPLLAAVLVPLFLVGLVGSLLVFAATLVRDLSEVVHSEEQTEADL